MGRKHRPAPKQMLGNGGASIVAQPNLCLSGYARPLCFPRIFFRNVVVHVAVQSILRPVLSDAIAGQVHSVHGSIGGGIQGDSSRGRASLEVHSLLIRNVSVQCGGGRSRLLDTATVVVTAAHAEGRKTIGTSHQRHLDEEKREMCHVLLVVESTVPFPYSVIVA